MSRIGTVMLVAAAVAAGLGQIPPGYEVVYLDVGYPYHGNAAINDRGQIVISARRVPGDSSTSELFLYDAGVWTQLTNDRVIDAFPDINNDGTIVWSRSAGADGSLEIFRRLADGTTTRLTNDVYWDYTPRLNESGDVVWSQLIRAGCGSATANVMLHSNAGAQTIYADGFSNQVVRMNAAGQIVWTRYNFCDSPWTSAIMLYSDGAFRQLTTDQLEPQSPGISDDGMVAWSCYRPLPFDDEIQIWRDGTTSILTNGGGLSVNRLGDIGFDRWYDWNGTWSVHRHYRGELRVIASDSVWNYDSDINVHGEMVWIHGTPPDDTVVGYLRRFPVGDMNCDRRVNALDIDSFVLALVDIDEYSRLNPACDASLADCNQDGRVNVFDIDFFVSAIETGG